MYRLAQAEWLLEKTNKINNALSKPIIQAEYYYPTLDKKKIAAASTLTNRNEEEIFES